MERSYVLTTVILIFWGRTSHEDYCEKYPSTMRVIVILRASERRNRFHAGLIPILPESWKARRKCRKGIVLNIWPAAASWNISYLRMRQNITLRCCSSKKRKKPLPHWREHFCWTTMQFAVSRLCSGMRLSLNHTGATVTGTFSLSASMKRQIAIPYASVPEIPYPTAPRASSTNNIRTVRSWVQQ